MYFRRTRWLSVHVFTPRVELNDFALGILALEKQSIECSALGVLYLATKESRRKETGDEF
jgi:hypothetical protein